MLKKMFRNILLITVFTVIPLSVSAQSSYTYFLSDVNAADFPAVSLNLRAVDSTNQTADNLTNSDFTLYENDQPVVDFQMLAQNDGPINLIYVIDLGRYVNYRALGLEKVQQALTYPVDAGYFQDGVDSVKVMARTHDGTTDQTVTLLEPTSDGGAFASFINTMDLSPGPGATQGLLAVETALDTLPEDSPPTSIIFLTPFIDRPADAEAVQYAGQLAEKAREKHVAIYTLHTHLLGQLPGPLQVLASESGGSYLRLTEDIDHSIDFERLYSTISAGRTYYQIGYRSTLGDSGTRTIAIAPPGQPASSAMARISYDITLQAPQVSIQSPSDNETIDLQIEEGEDGALTVTPDSLSISARLDAWPDGHPRQIVNVELLVDGQVADSQPMPADGNYDFTWNIGEIALDEDAEEPLSIPHIFQVRVTDELGIMGESQPVTTTLTTTPSESSSRGFPWVPILAGAFVIMLVLVGGGGFFLYKNMQKPKDSKPAQPAPSTSRPAYQREAAKTLIAGPLDQAMDYDTGQPLATLQVLEGPPDMRGMEIDIDREITRIGRNPDLCDVIFFREQVSSVSGLHCTLEFSGESAHLVDNNSTNGTQVNGIKITPMTSYTLTHGDEIILGSIAKQGVKLRFLQAASHTVIDQPVIEIPGQPGSGFDPADDKTMIEFDDFEELEKRRNLDDEGDDWMNDL